MSIQEDIRDILQAKGAHITFAPAAGAAIEAGGGGLEELGFVKPHRRMARVELWPGRHEIDIAFKPDGDAGVNATVVEWLPNKATYGRITPPGFVMTFHLSGCRSYLFRDGAGHVIGAHGYQGLEDDKRVIYDPVDYFLSRGAREIWEFHSAGTFKTPQKGKSVFAATLCYVDGATAYCFAFTYVETLQVIPPAAGARMGSTRVTLDVLDVLKQGKKEIPDWRRAAV